MSPPGAPPTFWNVQIYCFLFDYFFFQEVSAAGKLESFKQIMQLFSDFLAQ